MPPESLPLWCVEKNSSDHFIIKLKISSIWRSLIRARDTDSPRATDRALPLRIQTNTYKPTKLIPAKKLLTVCHTNIKHTNFFTTGDVFLSLCTSDLWVESHRSRIQQQKEWTMGYSSHKVTNIWIALSSQQGYHLHIYSAPSFCFLNKWP